MRAAFYETTGEARDVLRVSEIGDVAPAPGEVLVRVAVSAVHPSDVKTRAGARGPMAFPSVIPHSDGAGRIVAVGDGVDAARVGARVWLWNCAWKRAHGSASEYVALPSAQAVDLPDGASFVLGATLGIPAITAHRCLFSDGDIGGQVVIVTGGAGTVGSVAIQMAKRAGARVITTISNDEKARHAREMGADVVVNYREADAISQILDAAGPDKISRIVEVEFGGNLPVTRAVLGEGGTIAAYGSMGAPEPGLPFYDMMFANQTLRTVLAYSISNEARRAAEADISLWLSDGSLRPPISEEYPLTDIVAAHEAVEAGARMGVTLVRVAPDDAV